MADNPLPKISVAAPVASAAAGAAAVSAPTLIEVRDLSLFYGSNQALKKISLNIGEKVVTAFIGPSGCGKSTLLR